ncbi:MAG: hypothetical protein NXH82_00450 [Rhodobacteraceae bacterium]|nr:hypothetical protein [Paracoccaceae bacterium]
MSRRYLRLAAMVALLSLPAGCGLFIGAAGGAWTCTNLSSIGQQYMRADRAQDLNCGPGGAPIRVVGG